MVESLLPPRSATAVDKALDLTAAKRRSDKLHPAIDAIGEKWTDPGPELLDAMISEAKLDILRPYFDDLAALFHEGIRWQRVHGLVRAIHTGLAFAGASGRLEINPTRRRYWNGWQIGLDDRPALANLGKISRIAEASDPFRNDLERVFHGHDVRAGEFSYSRWGSALYSAHSGAKVSGSNPLWSLGRTHEFPIELTETELAPLDIWLAPTGNARWIDLKLPSKDIGMSWAELDAGNGATVMAKTLVGMHGYAAFYDRSGQMIGARRMKAAAVVHPALGSSFPYEVDGTGYEPAKTGKLVYVEAMTGFGNGAGRHAATVGLLFEARPRAGLPQARNWLEPEEIEAPFPPVGVQVLGIDLDDATRERVKWAIRFV
ncbi:conserved hypothetical protein [Roseibium sp. TrichSKD4]|uniref:hypothetical protein n=1 Tax=Roseibium sp. TrichSKD4 TaxID=744980 RepID=UPI0001E56F4C|nr:hypothetical protein [Roseibium sp. TrichSKD4]EFO31335.1 conserved hypothetical protein [Roseibium sp. TrichSKD4]